MYRHQPEEQQGGGVKRRGFFPVPQPQPPLCPLETAHSPCYWSVSPVVFVPDQMEVEDPGMWVVEHTIL